MDAADADGDDASAIDDGGVVMDVYEEVAMCVCELWSWGFWW